MKAFFNSATVLSLFILISTPSFAQEAAYTTKSGMTIGFGLGASYQTSDIKNSMGAGFDFHLGSYLYKREGAALAVDWKFRFLAGENRAHDHRINPDDTYSNIQFRHFNYDLELGLTLNRLMERTRIVLTGFAGAGITHGITHTDLLNSSGNPYDYSVINPAQSRAEINADLLSLSDKDYETKLVNKAAVLPTAGLYLGYQFSRSFSIGIIHKINFSLTEDNSVFGIDMDNNIPGASFIDMNHYTSVGFRWILGGGSLGGPTGSNTQYISPVQNQRQEVVPTRPAAIIPDTGSLPEVDITIPYNEIHLSSERNVNITARVRRIDNKDNIIVRYDNKIHDFEYDPQSRRVDLSVFLSADTSLLIITGRNEKGSAGDSLVLIFGEPAELNLEQGRTKPVTVTNPVRVNEVTRTNRIISGNEIVRGNESGRVISERREQQVNIADPVKVSPPVVSFINPRSPVSVEDNMFSLKVQTQNVASWDDVDVVVNRLRRNNYSFTRDGIVSLNIGLAEGVNTIEVSGENSAGRVTERTTITYKKSPLIDEAAANLKIVRDNMQVQQQQQQQQQQQEQEQERVREEEQQQVREEAASAIRINPGNADWQFCLVTPGGTYNRNNLTNSNFRYSGSATSLYIKPIGGDGTATVNGRPYKVRSGQYYLFTGSLTVTVSTSNPGSMGHWSVIVKANRAPSSGNGNRRPKSPCEGK